LGQPVKTVAESGSPECECDDDAAPGPTRRNDLAWCWTRPLITAYQCCIIEPQTFHGYWGVGRSGYPRYGPAQSEEIHHHPPLLDSTHHVS
jgi:hypothetical protein